MLAPVEFGLFAIAASVTALGAVFGDFGLPALQSSEIDNEHLSNLFWFNVLQSLLVVLLTLALAPLIDRIYHEPRLPLLLVAMSFNCVLYALGSQHQALLKRQMRFVRFNQIEIASTLLGIAVGIISSAQGAQCWALVMMQLVTTASASLGCWLCCTWRPGRAIRIANSRTLLFFGGHISAFNLLNYLTRNVDNLLIARFCGFGPLGLYDKAYQLYLLPSQQICWPIAGVVLSTLSNLRNEPLRFKLYARNTLLLVSGICMPIVAFLFVDGDTVVQQALGSRWTNVMPIFRALAPAAFADLLLVGAGWILLAQGESARLLKCRLVQTGITLVSFFIAIRWGVVGMALALSITRIVSVVPSLLFCSKGTPLLWHELATASFCPALASIGSAALIFYAGFWWHVQNSQVTNVLVDAVIFTASYFFISLFFPSARKGIAQVVETANKARLLIPPNNSVK
jgi:O-antigen/teichoic acid export membrane protein